jgi:hypothetical protein
MNKEIGINTLIKTKSLIDTITSRLYGFKIPSEFLSFDLIRLVINLDDVEVCFAIRVLDKDFDIGLKFSSHTYNYKKVKTKIIYNSTIFDLRIVDDKWLRVFKRESDGVTISDVTLKDFAISQNVEDNIISFIVLFLLGEDPGILSGYDKILVGYIKTQLGATVEPMTVSNVVVDSSFLNKDCSKTVKSL